MPLASDPLLGFLKSSRLWKCISFRGWCPVLTPACTGAKPPALDMQSPSHNTRSPFEKGSWRSLSGGGKGGLWVTTVKYVLGCLSPPPCLPLSPRFLLIPNYMVGEGVPRGRESRKQRPAHSTLSTLFHIYFFYWKIRKKTWQVIMCLMHIYVSSPLLLLLFFLSIKTALSASGL